MVLEVNPRSERCAAASVAPFDLSTDLIRHRHKQVLFGDTEFGIVPTMRSSRFISGESGQCEHPCWEPLELLLGADELCGHFMWMFEVELEDGSVLHAYKHRWTRAYLHLAGDGATYYYAGGKQYGRIDPYDAITAVFAGWERAKPTASERAALRVVLDRLGRER